MTQLTEQLEHPAEQEASSAQAETVIRCVGLTKVFRDFWMRNRVTAVNAIDMDVRRGEVFGLLGPNGSGKSTTIKMILGLLHPSAGRIAVFGHHPRDVATKQQIGYLPEESYLYPFLDARETLDYYGRLFHQNRRQRNQRTDMLLSMVGLDRVVRRPIGEYSKGMQRRIGLAQALINDPQLLILDEPTTGLDPIGTRQIKDLITQLAERGKTILLCSHLLADVEDVCDRVSIMFGGKIRKAGTVDQLLTQVGLTTVEADSLSNEDIEAIEKTLQARGKHIDKVHHPRQKLEDLFLQIVQDAQNEGADTSGARAGGAIAEFLVGDAAHLPESMNPDELLSKLEGDKATDAKRLAGDAKHPASATGGADSARGMVHPAPAPAVQDEQPSALEHLTHIPTKEAASPAPRDKGKDASSRAWSINEPAKPVEKEEEAGDQSLIDSLMKSEKEQGEQENRRAGEQKE